jgi:DNA invertase Pin-like site-specific DNA recombinase
LLAAAAEHERHMIGERTHHALAAAKARGIQLGNPEQAKINRAKPAARAEALRPHIERLKSEVLAVVGRDPRGWREFADHA